MRKEIKYLCVVMIVLVIAAVAVVLGCRSGKSRDEIDRTVQKYAPTGASVAIIEHGEIKEIRNYGYADKEERKPVTDQTRFKIASISKTVTSYAVMQLVEQGKLDLDVPVNKYLTEYGENKVTLRMLLFHTAGLTGSNEFGYTMPLPGIDEALKLQNVKLFMEHPNQVFTKSQIYHQVWDEFYEDDNTVMVYISHLREKIEEDPRKPRLLQTIRGIGYRLETTYENAI